MIKWFLGAALGLCMLIPGDAVAGGYGRGVIIYQPIVTTSPAEQGLEYYYKVNTQNLANVGGPTALTDADIDNIADRVATRVLAKLLSAAQGAENGQVPATTNPVQPQQPQPPVKPSLDSQVEAIVQRSCVSCHGATSPKGGLALVDANNKLLKLDQSTKWNCFDKVDTQAMPLNGDPLAVSEIETVREWARTK